jgi:hypothetical protein
MSWGDEPMIRRWLHRHCDTAEGMHVRLGGDWTVDDEGWWHPLDTGRVRPEGPDWRIEPRTAVHVGTGLLVIGKHSILSGVYFHRGEAS